MSLDRRGAVGAIGGLLAGAASMASLNAAQVLPQPARKHLTVKELTAEEAAELKRLAEATESAAMAQQEFSAELHRKYGADEPGIQVNFEDSYVFIRDYRAELAEKQAYAEKAYPDYPEAVQHALQQRW